MKLKKIFIANLPILSLCSTISCNNATIIRGEYNVNFLSDNSKFIGAKTTTKDKDYVVNIEYDDGYEFRRITIKINKSSLTLQEYKDYILNNDKTQLTIFKESIIGDISIYLLTKEKIKIDLQNDLGCTLTGADKVSLDQDYIVDITYNEGYEFASINIEIDGLTLEQNQGYEFNEDKTQLTIFKDSFKDSIKGNIGNIKISLTTKETVKTYSVNLQNGNGYTLTGADKASLDQDYIVNIAYEKDYEFASINIEIDGSALKPNQDYKFNEDKTQLTIFKECIKGNIKINLITEKKIKTTHKVNLKSTIGGSLIGEENTTLEKDYSVTIKYKQGYEFGEINVKVGANELIDGKQYTLDNDKTKLTIPNQFLIDNITIELITNIQWDYNTRRFKYTYSWNEQGDYTAKISYDKSVFEKIWIVKNIIKPNVTLEESDILFSVGVDEADFLEKITRFFSNQTCTVLTIPANIFKDNPIVAIKITCRDKN